MPACGEVYAALRSILPAPERVISLKESPRCAGNPSKFFETIPSRSHRGFGNPPPAQLQEQHKIMPVKTSAGSRIIAIVAIAAPPTIKPIVDPEVETAKCDCSNQLDFSKATLAPTTRTSKATEIVTSLRGSHERRLSGATFGTVKRASGIVFSRGRVVSIGTLPFFAPREIFTSL
jgi:hypothetical protein